MENGKKRKSLCDLEEQIKAQKTDIDVLSEQLASKQLLCYICHEQVKCPVKLGCKPAGHLACASCLSEELSSKKLPTRYYDGIPKVRWDEENNLRSNSKCGLCKTFGIFKFPGLMVFNLLDPDCSKQCIFCNDLFSLHDIGIHIIECPERILNCPWCEKSLKRSILQYHCQIDCKHLPCEMCNFQGNAFELGVHNTSHKLIESISVLLKQFFVTNTRKIKKKENVQILSEHMIQSLIILAETTRPFKGPSYKLMFEEFKNNMLNPVDLAKSQYAFIQDLIKNIQLSMESSEEDEPNYTDSENGQEIDDSSL